VPANAEMKTLSSTLFSGYITAINKLVKGLLGEIRAMGTIFVTCPKYCAAQPKHHLATNSPHHPTMLGHVTSTVSHRLPKSGSRQRFTQPGPTGPTLAMTATAQAYGNDVRGERPPAHTGAKTRLFVATQQTSAKQQMCMSPCKMRMLKSGKRKLFP